jgi:hypothetical protein
MHRHDKPKKPCSLVRLPYAAADRFPGLYSLGRPYAVFSSYRSRGERDGLRVGFLQYGKEHVDYPVVPKARGGIRT